MRFEQLPCCNHGAKALSSKMAPEAPFGQFRRFHRKSMIFAFFGFLETRIHRHSAVSGRHPLEIILDLLRNAIKSKIRSKYDCSKRVLRRPKNMKKIMSGENAIKLLFEFLYWNFEIK